MSPSMASSARFPGMMGPPGGLGPLASMAGFGPMGGMGPSGFPGMGGGMNPMIQQLLGQTFGDSLPKGLTGSSPSSSSPSSASSSSSSSAQGSQASGSNPTPTRTRFLSRLNPLNLFRRLRNRNNQSKDATAAADVKPAESMMTSESKRKSIFFKRMGSRSNDSMVESGNHPFGSFAMYPRTIFPRPPFLRFNNPGTFPVPQGPIIGSGFNFPRRRGRRIHEENNSPMMSLVPRVPSLFGSPEGTESRPVAMMGSGNFEVIRGGHFNHASDHHSGDESAPAKVVEQNGQKDPNNNFDSMKDDFYGSSSPVLGFQGFNHFSPSSSNHINALSSSNHINALSSSNHINALSSSASTSSEAEILPSLLPSSSSDQPKTSVPSAT